MMSSVHNRIDRIYKSQAIPEEKDLVMRNIRWCKDQHLSLAGFPFEDICNGLHLQIIVPPNTSREHIDQALREAYSERNIASHSVLECPVEWFQNA